jgi:hypothetical protein
MIFLKHGPREMGRQTETKFYHGEKERLREARSEMSYVN